MKKNSFIEGTIIATIAIVIVKILGMLYVIPFYAIVGIEGAALYAYAYNIYSLFLDISTAGVPSAISKIINEYNTLNKQEAKVRTYNIGKKILGFLAVVAFIIMFTCAPSISELIIGDLTGGNTVEDVTFVIRVVSFALLIFPFLSCARGFFQGHNIISVSAISNVIEQVARITVIIGGSYIALNLLHLDLTKVVGVAVFGATAGGLCALFYVLKKLRKNKKELSLEKNFLEKDNVSNKEIIKKIIKYSIPVIIISISLSIYNNVDMVLILRTMDHLGYSALDVEFIATGISTWSSKIGIIVASLAMGVSSSLIPNIVESFTLNKMDDVNNKYNKALQIIIFISLPMCVGISLLSNAIWSIFYGVNPLGTSILAFSIFTPLFSNLFTITNMTLQGINKFKTVYISAISGFLLNALLDVPFMLLFDFLKLPAYYGAILATIVGESIAVIIALISLKKAYNFNYKETENVFIKTLVPLFTMIVVVVLLKVFIPFNVEARTSCILFTAASSIIGAASYFIVASEMGLINSILGNDFINIIKNKFKRKKEV